MATKATKKEPRQEKLQVYVFENTWKDRHGDEGTNVKVFATKAAANKYLASDIVDYLTNHDAVSHGKISTGDDPESTRVSWFETKGISSDDGDCSLKEFTEAAAKCGWAEVNIDDEGTYASWSVSKQDVL